MFDLQNIKQSILKHKTLQNKNCINVLQTNIIFLLRVSGAFSSLILLASGLQIASTNIDVNLI